MTDIHCPVCFDLGVEPGHPPYPSPALGDDHHGQYDPADTMPVYQQLIPLALTAHEVETLRVFLDLSGYEAIVADMIACSHASVDMDMLRVMYSEFSEAIEELASAMVGFESDMQQPLVTRMEPI